MKFSINLEALHNMFCSVYFETEAKWDEYIVQFRWHRWNYNPQPWDMSPKSFPCLMLYTTDSIHIDNGNDEFPNFFFYEGEFTKTEE